MLQLKRNLGNILLSERKTQRINTVGLHFYEKSRTESTLVAARAGDNAMGWAVGLKHPSFLFWGDENVLKSGCDNGFTIL